MRRRSDCGSNAVDENDEGELAGSRGETCALARDADDDAPPDDGARDMGEGSGASVGGEAANEQGSQEDGNTREGKDD